MASLLKRSYAYPRGIRVSVTKPTPKTTNFVCQSSSYASKPPKDTITWPKYLEIRRGKRRWETILSIPSSILGLVGGAAYFGSQEIDMTKPIMGIDPMIFYSICTVACTGLGYLLGPTIGAACWRMTHRRTLALIEAKDREFHRHIVKNRVDPRAQGANNPVPDYHGEKIGSLHQYRQWLRDQAKFRQKAQFPEE